MLTRVVWRWELAAWRQRAAADGRLVLIAIAPLSLFLPLDHGGFFQSWLQGAVIIGWLYALFAAATLAADAGALELHALWLFQKGISLTDYTLARLLLASLGLIIAAGYAAGWFAIAAMLRDQFTISVLVTWSLTVSLVALISAAVLFLVASFDLRRGTDFLLVVTLLAMLRDLVFSGLPSVLRSALFLVLPPLHSALVFVQTLTSGDLENAASSATRLLSYMIACIAIAALRHGRWRPRLSSSA